MLFFIIYYLLFIIYYLLFIIYYFCCLFNIILNIMPFKIISEYYFKVNEVWKNGKKPTLKCSLVPLKKGLPSFYYTNFNTVTQDLLVNGLFEITWAYDGSVEDGNIGFLGTTNITSQGYTSESFFEGCAIELNRQVLEFYNKNGNEYEFIIEIYSDPDILQQQQSSDTNQVKVAGDATTTNTVTVTFTGGTTSTNTVDDIEYTVYTFTQTSNGSITFTNFTGTITILAVGGGGGGAPGINIGGGGAGGFIQTYLTIDSNGTIDITVGSGGIIDNGENTTLKSTTISAFTPIIAYGGGVGGANSNGKIGGSGGGGGGNETSEGGKGFSGQGYSGGGGASQGGGGGGGGANEAGTAGTSIISGNGGNGLIPTLNGLPTTDSNGKSLYYAGGGAGQISSGTAGIPGNGASYYGGGSSISLTAGNNGIVQIAILNTDL